MPFLNLLPATSEGYPTAQPARKASSVAETANTTSSLTTPDSLRPRRSSSISSSDSSRQRFLKLGPVYFGGDPSESDWVEEAVKE